MHCRLQKHFAEADFRWQRSHFEQKRRRSDTKDPAAFPKMLVGAGTVINKEQAERALAAGSAVPRITWYERGDSRICERVKGTCFPGSMHAV